MLDITVFIQWKSPLEWYGLGQNETITLVGPQFNETSRLTAFSDIQNLNKYIRQRETQGCVRWMSVNYLCTDGMIFALPG